MCGIAGAISRDVDRARPVVEALVDALHVRGPDHRGMAESSMPGGLSMVVGHQRLSIIDLSAAANQPMWDTSGRFCIVYNGEIYNYLELRSELRDLGHRFATNSDTEVILEAFKAWGPAAVGKLNGMFAFGLAIPSEGRFWLVRDRFGVKPLYYHHAADGLYFSSTPAVLARRFALFPNLTYVSRGLRHWIYEDDGPISPYEGVAAVPAGCLVEAHAERGGQLTPKVERYYHLLDRVGGQREELDGIDDVSAAARVIDLFQDAVRLRLRADVPIGISLSGGLDSTSIAVLLASMHTDVSGFSFGHPEVPDSEGPLVARFAASAGIASEYIWPTVDEGISAFWRTLEAQDAPFPSLSIVAQNLVFDAARRRGVKVLLGGQGADEVLMGYRKFHVLQLLDALQRRDPRDVLRYGASLVLMLVSESPRASVYLRHRRRYSGSAGLETPLRLPPAAPFAPAGWDGTSAWHRQVQDVTRLSLPSLLRYEDRNSMGNSLETRLPFLDYRFVELALSLPAHMKVRSGYGKWVMRQAMEGSLPSAITRARYKRGFDTPERSWIAGGLGAEIRKALRHSLPAIRQWLPANAVVDDLYGDRRLASHPTAIGEATSLLWLAQRIG
jgi:asparagine synthase (glutamine-hydrolysing)